MENSARTVAVIIVLTIMTIVFGVCCYFWKKGTLKFERLFLLTIIPLGLAYLFTAPALTGNDDPHHFFRVHEIVNGNFITPIYEDKVGSEFDNGTIDFVQKDKIYSTNIERIQITSNGDSTAIQEYPNTALYSPISYIPQAVGMFIGKTLHFSPFWLTTIARLFNFMSYVGLCYLAFKILPRFKLFFLVLMVSPAILSCAISLSADAFLCALVFLFVALILHINYNNVVINKRHIFVLLGLSVLIAGCKVVYFPIIFLLFLIRKRQFGGLKKKMIVVIGCIVLAVVISGLWMQIANKFLSVAYPLADEQKSMILKNPVSYLLVLLKTCYYSFFEWVGGIYSGTPLFHNRVELSGIVVLGYVLVGILSIFNEKRKCIFSNCERSAILIITMSVVLLVCTAVYIQWTAKYKGVNYPMVVGVQGRYFIPCVTLLMMMVDAPKRRVDKMFVIIPIYLLQLYTIGEMLIAFSK